MAQFKFGLSTVLKIREDAERDCKAAMAMAQIELQRREAEMDQIDREVAEVNQSIVMSHLTGVVDVALLTQHKRYLAGAKLALMKVVRSIGEQRLVVESARRKLAEAARDRKAMEFLKETQLTRWKDEQSKKESVEADDTAMQMAFAELQRDDMGSLQ